MIKLNSDDIWLFQGDSITHGNRGLTPDPNHILGHGYACMVAARLAASNLKAHPVFINRGVSGDCVRKMHARWQEDCLDLHPTLLSILIGINDNARETGDDGLRKGTPTELFKQTYTKALDEALAINPKLKLVLCEPFYVPAEPMPLNEGEFSRITLDDTLKHYRVNDDTRECARRREYIDSLRPVVKALSEEYKCCFVPLQELLTEAQAQTIPGYVVWDGVHPTMAGHELITNQWLNCVDKFYYSDPSDYIC